MEVNIIKPLLKIKQQQDISKYFAEKDCHVCDNKHKASHTERLWRLVRV